MTRLFQLIAADDGLHLEINLEGDKTRLRIQDTSDSLVDHALHELWRRLRSTPPTPIQFPRYEYKEVYPDHYSREG